MCESSTSRKVGFKALKAQQPKQVCNPGQISTKIQQVSTDLLCSKKNIGTIVCYSMLCEWMMMGYVLTPNCKVDTALRRPLVTKH